MARNLCFGELSWDLATLLGGLDAFGIGQRCKILFPFLYNFDGNYYSKMLDDLATLGANLFQSGNTADRWDHFLYYFATSRVDIFFERIFRNNRKKISHLFGNIVFQFIQLGNTVNRSNGNFYNFQSNFSSTCDMATSQSYTANFPHKQINLKQIWQRRLYNSLG